MWGLCVLMGKLETITAIEYLSSGVKRIKVELYELKKVKTKTYYIDITNDVLEGFDKHG